MAAETYEGDDTRPLERHETTNCCQPSPLFLNPRWNSLPSISVVAARSLRKCFFSPLAVPFPLALAVDEVPLIAPSFGLWTNGDETAESRAGVEDMVFGVVSEVGLGRRKEYKEQGVGVEESRKSRGVRVEGGEVEDVEEGGDWEMTRSESER